jgi:RNA polymerase sigma-70 factor (ECF subfamily)
LKDEDNSRDVVQEAFERLWKNRSSIDQTKAKSYLFTTAYHIMIDFIRKNKRVQLVESYDTQTYFHNTQYSDLNEILEKAIDTLPDLQKQLIMLRDYEGYSYKEIGEITNLNESQVKVYIFRARNLLKEYIGKVENVV